MKNSLLLLSATLLLCACGGGDSKLHESRLSLSVTDAPVDHADAVVVSFISAELLDASGAVKESFVLDPPLQIDLLSLQGANSAFLIDDAVVAPGVYQEVRLKVDAENANCNAVSPPYASYVTVDGVDYPLIVPSGGSSGFKVKGPLTVAVGGSVAYTIDFDLRQSIAERGATDCYNLKPVLRVVDNATVGTLSGIIDGSLLADSSCTADTATGAGAAVYLFAGAGVTPDDVDGTTPEPLTSALLTATGNDQFSYEVGFLPAGAYTVALTCQAGDDDPETDDPITFLRSVDVQVDADSVTTQDFTAPSLVVQGS
ncbi:DUF4382 domain-containing protein [Sinimarinibacterium sp. CAU 1509]|uniref:DUF4382 domain-containing protein n=1 Tax=Sinimarinibacterium sp. CAU 1509 TaxID=2562283 RepID=UPI0010AB6DA2|nr:DUF4382 domain-containing protein [Sinimarinibacterium sp. CAU 1509]TJY61932.1 DUF4382 domain-containing protein [Sinimarinibacterium sp. CAU 1509]